MARVLAYKAGAFIDVGANKGQSLTQLLCLDTNRQYIGFEPDLSHCASIEALIVQNGLKNHLVFPLALSNRSGLAKIFIRQGTSTVSSLVEGFRPLSFYSHIQYIPVMPGDTIIADLQPAAVAVIKIDVEGGELEVVEGLSQSIARYTPFIIFEVLPHYLALIGEAIDEETVLFRQERVKRLENVLREARYALYRIEPENVLKHIRNIDPGTKPDLSRTNYLAIPMTDKEKFLGENSGGHATYYRC